MSLPFLNSDILLHHLLQDAPDQSARATAYLARVEKGELKVRLADTVIFETVSTLEQTYGVPKAEIAAALVPLVALPGMTLPHKYRFRRVFDRYVRLDITFANAYHATLIESLRITRIISFNQGFDHIRGIQRNEL